MTSLKKMILPAHLGHPGFKKSFNTKLALVAGGMFRGIASEAMVIRMGKAGLLSFFGAGGIPLKIVERSIDRIRTELTEKNFGVNVLHNPFDSTTEENLIDLLLKKQVSVIEAAAFTRITPALVRYRAKGLLQGLNGKTIIKNRLMAKVSRPEFAELFMRPAPDEILHALVSNGRITHTGAALSRTIPMADAVCVEADSGGHTDRGSSFILIPTVIKLRNRIMKQFGYSERIYIGSGGGIGTPESVAASLILGADFVLTGSINQCTVEAGTSDLVKSMLQTMNIQDTNYAPAGDMFELGSQVQVLKKGVLFPFRANKLYELYRKNDSIDTIDQTTKRQLEEKFFRKSFNEVYQETCSYFWQRDPKQIEKAENNSKHKMALIFRWYFNRSVEAALAGDETERVNFQIHSGPALGAFNQSVRGTHFENWKKRHVDSISGFLMEGAAEILNNRIGLPLSR